MNRRRFLKYVGATAAVVGAAALGVDYVLTPKSFTRTNSTEVTSASSLTTSGLSPLASYASKNGLSQPAIDELGAKLGDKLTTNNQELVDYLSSMAHANLVSPDVLQLTSSDYAAFVVESLQIRTIDQVADEGNVPDQTVNALSYLSSFPGSTQRWYIEQHGLDASAIDLLTRVKSLSDQEFARYAVESLVCIKDHDPLTSAEIAFLQSPGGNFKAVRDRYLATLEARGNPYDGYAKSWGDMLVGSGVENEIESLDATEDWVYLLLNSDDPRIGELSQWIAQNGLPDSRDFNFHVPTFNVHLSGVYQSARTEEFKTNDTFALVIPIVDSIFREIGDQATLTQLNSDSNAMLELGRELDEWQKANGYPRLADDPIEAQMCWANRAPAAYVREFYDDAGMYYGNDHVLGSRNPFHPFEYSAYSATAKNTNYPKEAYLWYTTDPKTRREMWLNGAKRWNSYLSQSNDYSSAVDGNVEGYFWTRSFMWDYEAAIQEPVDGVRVNGGGLMDVDYNWNRFKDGLKPIGTSNAAMVFMSEFINSMGVPSTIAWRHTYQIRKKTYPGLGTLDYLGEHGHPLFYDSSTQGWRANPSQYVAYIGVDTDVSFDEPEELIIVRPPAFLPRFLYQQVTRPAQTEGNPYQSINNKNLNEIAQLLSNLPESDARNWFLPTPENRL